MKAVFGFHRVKVSSTSSFEANIARTRMLAASKRPHPRLSVGWTESALRGLLIFHPGLSISKFRSPLRPRAGA